MEDIKIVNRDGRHLTLTCIEENKFSFPFEDHIRISPMDSEDENCKDFCMLDPSGGPRFDVGGMIDAKHIITRIYADIDKKCYILETKNSY